MQLFRLAAATINGGLFRRVGDRDHAALQTDPDVDAIRSDPRDPALANDVRHSRWAWREGSGRMPYGVTFAFSKLIQVNSPVLSWASRRNFEKSGGRAEEAA